MPAAGVSTVVHSYFPVATFRDKDMKRTDVDWYARPSFRHGAITRDAAPRNPITHVSKEDITGSAPAFQPGYTARARTLPNGVYHEHTSTRSVDPVDPKYQLPHAPAPFPDLDRSISRAPLPGTNRPKWHDLSDIPGTSAKVQYHRPTPYDAFAYNDVEKKVKTFRGGFQPRATVMDRIDVGKLPEVPFNRSVDSNPLDATYKYDTHREKTFEFNASMSLGRRGSMTGDPAYEVLGHIGSLRHGGLGGTMPAVTRRFTRGDNGLKKLYTGAKPFQ